MAKQGAGQAKGEESKRVVAVNRRARHDYQIVETLEVGICLLGSEVKSLREGRISFQDAYAEVKDGELWLVGAEIAEYVFAHQLNHPPKRRRKLLAHRSEIQRLEAKTRERGMTLVPLELYFSKGKAKILLGVARGRQQYDHREEARQRDRARDLAEQLAHMRKAVKPRM